MLPFDTAAAGPARSTSLMRRGDPTSEEQRQGALPPPPTLAVCV